MKRVGSPIVLSLVAFVAVVFSQAAPVFAASAEQIDRDAKRRLKTCTRSPSPQSRG